MQVHLISYFLLCDVTQVAACPVSLPIESEHMVYLHEYVEINNCGFSQAACVLFSFEQIKTDKTVFNYYLGIKYVITICPVMIWFKYYIPRYVDDLTLCCKV